MIRPAMLLAILASCGGRTATPTGPGSGGPSDPPPADTAAVVADLVGKHGEGERARIERGVAQAAALWQPADGDLAAFAREQFLPAGPVLDASFARFDSAIEQLDGHLYEIERELKNGVDLDLAPILPVDSLLAGYDPAANLIDDLFASKVAFSALLNFPLTTLADKRRDGASYDRRRWAEVRLTDRFAARIPAAVKQAEARATAAAEVYVADYNLWIHHLLDERGARPFPRGMRLLSHWNLRDQIKAEYAEPAGLPRQRLIRRAMERIVDGSIPAAVVNDPRVDWDPVANTTAPAPAAAVEAEAPPARPDEPADRRYAVLLEQYRAARAGDPYSPTAPTRIARAFDTSGELPEERVVAMLTEVLSSPLVPRVAALIEQRLGRELEPHDLWYDGFQARSQIAPAELDALTRKRYPNAAAFSADLPRILRELGFAPERADWLAARVVVEPARGSGHARESKRRGDLPHLRTRIGAGGMDYKGYNIAIHELGHSVEQLFSLYFVDHQLLRGVPNTAFTEALAFVFQDRDLALLGLGRPDAEAERMRVLNTFWQTWEIAGVALVDIQVWHWMYEHPDATAAELRGAVVEIARATWDEHYAPVLGGQGSPLLGVYSHMLEYPLYLYNYPLGHLIQFQIEEHLDKGGVLGAEFERMASHGKVLPDVWMEHATGRPVEAGPLLRATEAALP